MKLRKKDGNQVFTNIDNAESFKIKASAKAFRILSDNLYSDKITAIIRELSCNAADSHIVANKKDLPLDIHLPNKFEPYFSVRDYGTGMSEETIMSLYTSYFDSDKVDSNDITGALGLGSKSPFAYTDSFNVESVFNKKRKLYSAYINDQGFPCIQKMFFPCFQRLF